LKEETTKVGRFAEAFPFCGFLFLEGEFLGQEHLVSIYERELKYHMKIAVIDGQGGGIGKVLTEKIRKHFGDTVELLVLGTNAVATALMIKAGADDGASGENAIIYNAAKVDVIVGPLGIVVPCAMLGEITPRIAEAVASSPAPKLLLPLTRGNLSIVSSKPEPLPHLIVELIDQLNRLIQKGEENKNV